jgi:hypothetical protein
MISLHEQDFYAWTTQQAALLRAGRLAEADIEHIAEELEDMGKSEKRSLEGHLTVLLAHLLKWRYQPERRGNSWRLTIIEHRGRIEEAIMDSPSLKPTLSDTLLRAYRYARIRAARETGRPLGFFPEHCPFELPQALDEKFWPES